MILTTIKRAPTRLQNIPKLNFKLITLPILATHPELNNPPFRHDPSPDILPGVHRPHDVTIGHDPSIQGPSREPMIRPDWAEDDFVMGVGDRELRAFEKEAALVGEAESQLLRLKGLELDSAVASGFPVLVLREDLDGEDGIVGDGVLEVGEKLIGYGALGNVVHPHSC